MIVDLAFFFYWVNFVILCCSYNQSTDFIGEELSLNPLKLDDLSKSAAAAAAAASSATAQSAAAGAEVDDISPVTETLWLSPTGTTTSDCPENYYFSDEDNDLGRKTTLPLHLPSLLLER